MNDATEVAGPNPSGYCMCGCGERTPLSYQSDSRNGNVAGKPQRYVYGHYGKTQRRVIAAADYTVEDRGYESPCWIWRWTTNWAGYGQCSNGSGRLTGAHRLSYEQAVGNIPDGLELDHLCRVRACVNPEHLEPVTHAENGRRGTHARITYEVADEIRRVRAEERLSLRAIGARFGVSNMLVRRVLSGRSWTRPHVSGDDW